MNTADRLKSDRVRVNRNFFMKMNTAGILPDRLKSDRVRIFQSELNQGRIPENMRTALTQIELGQLDELARARDAAIEQQKNCNRAANTEFRDNYTDIPTEATCEKAPETCTLSEVAVQGIAIESGFSLMKNSYLYMQGTQSGYELVQSVVADSATGVVRYSLVDIADRLVSANGMSITYNWLIVSELVDTSRIALKNFWLGNIDQTELITTLARSFGDSVVQYAGVSFGAFLGKAIGEYFGFNELGVNITSAVFGALGWKIAAEFGTHFSNWIFGPDPNVPISREELLRRSYEFLECQPTDDDLTIRRSYLRLSLQLHPDRGGSHDAMVALNSAYEMVRAARGL